MGEDYKQNLAVEIQRAIRKIDAHEARYKQERAALEESLARWQRVWRNNNYGQYPF